MYTVYDAARNSPTTQLHSKMFRSSQGFCSTRSLDYLLSGIFTTSDDFPFRLNVLRNSSRLDVISPLLFRVIYYNSRLVFHVSHAANKKLSTRIYGIYGRLREQKKNYNT